MKAEAKDGNKSMDALYARPDVIVQSDEDAAIAVRQVTMTGVVSSKQRRLLDNRVDVDMPSYNSCTLKECLCLEYIAGFQCQFERIFPTRRALYLNPPNENGVPKFVCTTIRPTLLPYRELYDCHTLARFLAGMIQYEPLANPLNPPLYLPSPTFTLKWQAGDSFDMATLLASFMIGAGYDAYVVNGIAPKWLCLLDQSKTPLPDLPVEKELHTLCDRIIANDRLKARENTNQVPLRSRTTFTSKILENQESEVKEVDNVHIEDNYRDDGEEEKDFLEGKRVHAWVLVRAGSREVPEHFFLEPSTGRMYALDTSPYILIESIWNHENYWVNMQQQAVHLTRFDLSNSSDWEYAILSIAERKVEAEADQDAKGGSNLSNDLEILSTKLDDQLGIEATDNDLILDIPPSWVHKLQIDRATFKKKFVQNSQQITLFHRAKVEEFAEGTHEQGLVVRVTLFRDEEYTLPIEIREYFQNRKDRLESRFRFPFEGKFEEFFAAGRNPDALQSRTEWLGYRRDFHFYTDARSDGLVTRQEEIQKRVVEHFDKRDDFLCFRSVTLASENEKIDARNPYILPGGPTGEIGIRSMKEKFARNMKLVADEDQRKRAYNVREGSIQVFFHYAEGKITASSRTYHKAPNVPIEVVMADPTSRKPKLSVLEDEMRTFLQTEKDCYNAIRRSDIETQDILKTRKREESAIVLETNVFDQNEHEVQDQDKEDVQELEMVQNEVDYLSPFLPSGYATEKILTKEEAQAVRDLCLRNLKERLLERANIIQGRLNKENSQLAKRQAAYQRSQREHIEDPDDDFERFCSDTMFRIQILEQRLTRHEETALLKYAEMDKRLNSDPRLRVLHR
ncbi:uncharacterized protein PHALS_04437 [Plasmopara halstedii]|uniref:Dynein regulatory complex subunit 7 n=1 Tax=Plasmopara halstedii TaxID=4781 RepID=A0A0P1B1H8_PLAHL|nr:uncharacterized protein PHALS_04437 [Plasmopara halstedii]CEG47569.1 hypothetical protein PHALS_04437 [Plasmopara halstedii]|eukprot:XP_024583938.1 hypothetical protein PHALS_04437 [Plasmopara halstedii]